MKSPLPVLTDLAYAMAMTARRAVAIRSGTAEPVAPDCIIVTEPTPTQLALYHARPFGDEPRASYAVCIGDVRVKRDTLEAAIQVANDVLGARSHTYRDVWHDFEARS